MRSETLAALGLGALAAGLCLAALLSIGGPEAGRAERRDDVRRQDLYALSAAMSCTLRQSGGTPPETLAPAPSCAAEPRLADPFTGTPYRYEPLGPDSFRLCADFEALDPERAAPVGHGIDSEGCLTRQDTP